MLSVKMKGAGKCEAYLTRDERGGQGQFILGAWSIVSLPTRNQINQKDSMNQIPASPSDKPPAAPAADQPLAGHDMLKINK